MADRMIYRGYMDRKMNDAVQRGGSNNKTEKTSDKKTTMSDVDDVTKDMLSQIKTRIDESNDPAFVKNLRSAFKGMSQEIEKKAGKMAQEDIKREAKEEVRQSINNFVDALRSTKLFGGKSTSTASDRKASNEPDIAYIDENGDVHPAGETGGTEGSSDDIVEFSYVPGDTFGQKILDLGLATDKGLWGDDGDVAFYTQQLRDQGALDERGNVILGKTWKLKRRK